MRGLVFLSSLSLVFIATCGRLAAGTQPPHIIFILADDLGWNDVGFHGSGQIPTPNIDALAYSGIILNRYYVTPICTPSRSALMTGKHPIHTGMQHGVLKGAEPRGLPLKEKLLPQYLQELGYNTHIVGKWHLGFYTKDYTPLHRGFESHFGFWTGHHDYFDHTAVENPYWGLDMRDGMDPAWSYHGQYSTQIFTKKANNVIERHNASNPLFLYIAHAAVHSGNPYNPLPAPQNKINSFAGITDINRRQYAAIVSELDDSVGQVMAALKKQEMLENSIVIFSTDNGGPAAGFNLNAASNWPLRGVKNTLWEGGVRGAGLIWSPLLQKPKRVSNQLMHITDWLPTLLSAAGGTASNLTIDGVDLWEELGKDKQSQRSTVLHNIDDAYKVAGITSDKWKLVKGTTYKGAWDGWYGPSGRDKVYDVGRVLASPANSATATVQSPITQDIVKKLRAEATIKCAAKNETLPVCNALKKPCLFNIYDDPCEMNNLIDLHQDIAKKLEDEIYSWNSTAVKPSNLPWDIRGDPKLWNNTWTNYGDYLLTS